MSYSQTEYEKQLAHFNDGVNWMKEKGSENSKELYQELLKEMNEDITISVDNHNALMKFLFERDGYKVVLKTFDVGYVLLLTKEEINNKEVNLNNSLIISGNVKEKVFRANGTDFITCSEFWSAYRTTYHLAELLYFKYTPREMILFKSFDDLLEHGLQLVSAGMVKKYPRHNLFISPFDEDLYERAYTYMFEVHEVHDSYLKRGLLTDKLEFDEKHYKMYSGQIRFMMQILDKHMLLH